MPDLMGWIRWLPGLTTLREYQASWLMHEVAAGFVLATMLVPVGTGWYRVRRRIGRTRYLWSLRDHRPATGLCIVRA